MAADIPPWGIEEERSEDADAIDDVVRRAFATQPGVDVMVRAIRASPRYLPRLALVARVEDAVVGFVMISHTDLVGADGTTRETLTLTPLAVAPEFERRGIGSALVRAVLAAADTTGAPLVVLEGSPRLYGPLGFRPAAEHGITLPLPDWAPPQAAQVFLLSGYDPSYRGRVIYPPAIAAVT